MPCSGASAFHRSTAAHNIAEVVDVAIDRPRSGPEHRRHVEDRRECRHPRLGRPQPSSLDRAPKVPQAIPDGLFDENVLTQVHPAHWSSTAVTHSMQRDDQLRVCCPNGQTRSVPEAQPTRFRPGTGRSDVESATGACRVVVRQRLRSSHPPRNLSGVLPGMILILFGRQAREDGGTNWGVRASITSIEAGQIISSPCRTPMVTASVRLRALSFTKMEAMWNLTVCSEIPSRAAMILLPSPSAIMPSTSISRGVRG